MFSPIKEMYIRMSRIGFLLSMVCLFPGRWRARPFCRYIPYAIVRGTVSFYLEEEHVDVACSSQHEDEEECSLTDFVVVCWFREHSIERKIGVTRNGECWNGQGAQFFLRLGTWLTLKVNQWSKRTGNGRETTCPLLSAVAVSIRLCTESNRSMFDRRHSSMIKCRDNVQWDRIDVTYFDIIVSKEDVRTEELDCLVDDIFVFRS